MRNDLAFVNLLRKRLDYDPDTGIFLFKPRDLFEFRSDQAGADWNSRHAGKPAFQRYSPYGMSENINAVSLLAHNTAWAIHYGYVPTSGTIKHKNGNKRDNRIANLVEVVKR